MEKYYYIKDDKQLGPFSLDELVEQNISPETLIWSKTMEEWTNAKNVSVVFEKLDIPPPAPPIVPNALIQKESEGEAKGTEEIILNYSTSPPVNKEESKYVRVGGSLLVVIILLWLGTILNFVLIFVSEEYDTLFWDVIAGIALGYATYLAFLETKERKQAREVFFSYLSIEFFGSVKYFTNDDSLSRGETIVLIAISLIITGLFALYFYNSERVRRTFNSYRKGV